MNDTPEWYPLALDKCRCAAIHFLRKRIRRHVLLELEDLMSAAMQACVVGMRNYDSSRMELDQYLYDKAIAGVVQAFRDVLGRGKPKPDRWCDYAEFTDNADQPRATYAVRAHSYNPTSFIDSCIDMTILVKEIDRRITRFDWFDDQVRARRYAHMKSNITVGPPKTKGRTQRQINKINNRNRNICRERFLTNDPPSGNSDVCPRYGISPSTLSIIERDFKQANLDLLTFE